MVMLRGHTSPVHGGGKRRAMELWNFSSAFGAFCNLTHLRRNEQNSCVLGFETVKVSTGVVLSCNSWRQARVCMALARVSDDPALKQYYEEMALGFVQNAANEHDPDDISSRVSPTQAATPIGTDANKP